jgi:hypothetical protein
MVAHSALTTASELHEPKGAAAASADTVYVADGAASGAFAKIDTANLDTSSIFDTNQFELRMVIADISTAETLYIPVPHAVNVVQIVTCLAGAITGSDATVTVKNAAATTMTGGAITIAVTGSGAGVTDSGTITGNNAISANSFFTVETDGASTGTVVLAIVITCTRTA